MLRTIALIPVLLSGAIFGFFYAWVCSTMWGLDGIDPQVAITAMNAMNGSVRNSVFAAGFFGTPVALLAVAALAVFAKAPRAALAFGTAGVIYLAGGLYLTLTIHVPMNQELALIATVSDSEAAAIWAAYSPDWQYWNIVRTIICGGVLALAVFGFGQLPKASAA